MNNNQKLDYIEHRLNEKIKYYKTKSDEAKKYDTFFKVVQIISAAIATVLTSYTFQYNSTILSTICTIICIFLIISQSITAYKQFYSQHIRYKLTCELLKQEKFFYLENVDPYNKTNSLKLLVKRCEKIITDETRSWQASQKETEVIEIPVNNLPQKIIK